MQLLAHWWNGSWGTMTRRDVWLEHVDDGWFQVRWRGGDWFDRDGARRTPHPRVVMAILGNLLADGKEWKPIGGTLREVLLGQDDPTPPQLLDKMYTF